MDTFQYSEDNAARLNRLEKQAAQLTRQAFAYLGLFASFQEALSVGRRVAAFQLASSILQILSVAV